MADNPLQVRARFDDPGCKAALDTALAGSGLINLVGLVNVQSEECLLARAGEPPAGAAEPDLLALSQQLFAGGDAPAQAARPAGPLVALSLQRQTIYGREAENLLLRRCGDRAEHALLLSVSNTLPDAAATALCQRLAAAAATADLQALLGSASDVMAGALIRIADGELVATYRRADDASKVRINRALARALTQALAGVLAPDGAALVELAAASMERVTAIDIEIDGHLLCFSQVPMVPEHVLCLWVSSGIDRAVLRRLQREAGNDILRQVIATLLESGLQTQMAPFPATDAEFLALVSELRALGEDDLIARLDIGGFAPHEVGEGIDLQRCKECIYYLPHRKWCDIPELPLPVEPHWWCRLWKL